MWPHDLTRLACRNHVPAVVDTLQHSHPHSHPHLLPHPHPHPLLNTCKFLSHPHSRFWQRRIPASPTDRQIPLRQSWSRPHSSRFILIGFVPGGGEILHHECTSGWSMKHYIMIVPVDALHHECTSGWSMKHDIYQWMHYIMNVPVDDIHLLCSY